MILKDRVSDIYQNYSICEKGCEYNFFDVEKLYANCTCKIKTSVSNQIKEGNFKEYILSSFLYSNFGIIKCYKLVFGIKGKLTNLGFWLFGVILISHFPIYIIYFINKINPIKNYIDNEMNNNGYKVNNKQTPNTKEINQKDTEEEEIKKIPYNSKKRSKFYKNKKSNFPPKKIINNTFYSKNNTFQKKGKEISSSDSFQNENEILDFDIKLKKSKKIKIKVKRKKLIITKLIIHLLIIIL